MRAIGGNTVSKPHSFFLAAFAIIFSFVSAGYSVSESPRKPLRRAEVMAMIAGRSLPKNIAHEVATRGLAFHPSDTYLQQLKTAGAGSPVIEAVGKARVANPNNINPDKWEAELLERLTRTSVLMNQQQYDKAIEQLTAALDASVASPEAGFVMGAILREEHDWPESAAVYKEVLREDPQFPDAHTKLSYLLYRLDDSDGAVREAKIALAENPGNAEAHKNAALGFQIGGQLDGAIAEYQEALRLKPDYGVVHFDLGILYELKHDVAAATGEYKKAVALEPNTIDYRYNLGTILGNSGETEAAIHELREAKRLAPTRFDVRMNLAIFLEKLDMRGAVAEFRELEKIAPDSQVCHKCMAGALYATGDRQGAVEEYRKAAEMEPTDQDVPMALGWLLEQDNKYDDALVVYRSAERMADYSGASHLAVGRVLVAKKDYVSAVQELKKATTVSPSAAEAHDLLGKALAESGDSEGAASEFKEALAIDPKRYAALVGLAKLSEKKGDWPQAMEQYRQAAAVEGNSNHEDHHGQPFLYSSVAESAYGAAQLRFDEHVKALTAAGKLTEVADLSSRVKSVQASASDSAKLQEFMHAGMRQAGTGNSLTPNTRTRRQLNSARNRALSTRFLLPRSKAWAAFTACKEISQMAMSHFIAPSRL
jgi:tetratricopeptide (TPR) repeat protein